jgi:hypothetical protein
MSGTRWALTILLLFLQKNFIKSALGAEVTPTSYSSTGESFRRQEQTLLLVEYRIGRPSSAARYKLPPTTLRLPSFAKLVISGNSQRLLEIRLSHSYLPAYHDVLVSLLVARPLCLFDPSGNLRRKKSGSMDPTLSRTSMVGGYTSCVSPPSSSLQQSWLAKGRSRPEGRSIPL